MIFNIIDHRKRRYRWKKITAIVEPTYHDNSCDDSDQAEETLDDISYDERAEISLADAVIWVQSLPFPATLYLYDLGDGVRSTRRKVRNISSNAETVEIKLTRYPR